MRPKKHDGGVPHWKRDICHRHLWRGKFQPGVFCSENQSHDQGGENVRLGVCLSGGQYRRDGDGGSGLHFSRLGSGLCVEQHRHRVELLDDV